MASIFKKTTTRPLPANAEITECNVKGQLQQVAKWKDRTGKTKTAPTTLGKDGIVKIKVKASTYTAKYRDGDGIVQEVATGCQERQSAQSVLVELTNRAELVKAKVLTSDQAKIADHQDKLLVGHIAAYIGYHKEQRRNSDYVKSCNTRLTESAMGCGFTRLYDLSVDKLETWLATERDGDRKLSAAVYNGYVEVWSAFGNWLCGKRTTGGKRHHMQGEKRLLKNPFAGMGKLDVNQDRRRIARALTEAELGRLLLSAQTRPIVDAETVRRGPNKGQRIIKLSDVRRAKLERLGRERALIYKTAILTGLRKNELRTLTIGDLSFGNVPFAKLKHSNEKNRQGSTVPLRSDLATELREWTKGLSSTENVFRVPYSLLEILDRDIEAAGIPKIDAEGRVVHIHALRHSFGTHLSMAGVSPRVAQAAMRHSNISLTMTTYTDSRLLDTAAAVESLPSFALQPMDHEKHPSAEISVPSDDAQDVTRTVAPTVAPTAVQTCQNQSIGVTLDKIDDR